MKKVITHIDCPKEWESENDYDSHRPLLWLVSNKVNNIIELGMGDGSTPLLVQWEKGGEQRNLCSVEHDEDYINKYISGYTVKFFGAFIGYQKDGHGVLKCKNFDDYFSTTELLFVDCAPAIVRKQIIDKCKDSATIIIAHDTEPGAEYVYGMNEVLSSFKYRLDYQPEGKPHTTAVSNYIDVTSWL